MNTSCHVIAALPHGTSGILVLVCIPTLLLEASSKAFSVDCGLNTRQVCERSFESQPPMVVPPRVVSPKRIPEDNGARTRAFCKIRSAFHQPRKKKSLFFPSPEKTLGHLGWPISLMNKRWLGWLPLARHFRYTNQSTCRCGAKVNCTVIH